MGIFQRPRSESLGDTPKSRAKGEKRAPHPHEKTPKWGKGDPSPSYAQVAKSQTPTNEEEWQLVTKKRKKKREKGEEGGGPCAESTAKPKLKRSTLTRSGDAIKVSAKDGQSYAEILKEMKALVEPRRAGLKVLSIWRTRKKEVFLLLKKGGDVSAFRKELDWSSTLCGACFHTQSRSKDRIEVPAWSCAKNSLLSKN